MPIVYRSNPHDPAPEAGAVVVHCSDPRFQHHFQDFLRHSLGLANYALVAVPGGPQLLARLDFLPKFSWSGWRWLKFLIGLTRPQRVVLISHEDCRWYFSLGVFKDPTTIMQRQVADLHRIRQEFAERFRIPRIETYYARLEENRAVFEEV